ncbi:MAG TPA: serine hydrolase [Gaiellaceae bacterium]|nr:serine hydrolase [Gaiellaceae bacterium]
MCRAFLAVVACLAALAAPVQASSGELTRSATEPRVAAAAWYLVGDDGALLAAHRARQRRAVASITKLMTAVVTLERSSPSDVVTVRDRVPVAGESTVYLRTGETLTVAELVRAALVPSANDAAHALAMHVGGGSVPRFVALMNSKASELGLTDTTFRNPHGLDAAGHVSSARDATLLLRYALGIPFLRDSLGRTSVSLPGGREFPTTDDLREAWPRLVGGKTGHTRDAGWSQAAAATAKGVTVYGTVLGSATRGERNDALRALLQHGLDRYGRVTAVDAGRVYAEATTGYGRRDAELVVRRSLVRTVRDDLPLVERVVAPTSVDLPVLEGQTLGRVEIWYQNRLLASSNLVAASAISEPGLLGKAWWYVRSTADTFWGFVT